MSFGKIGQQPMKASTIAGFLVQQNEFPRVFLNGVLPASRTYGTVTPGSIINLFIETTNTVILPQEISGPGDLLK